MLVPWYFSCEIVFRVVDVWEAETLLSFKMIIVFGGPLRKAIHVK